MPYLVAGGLLVIVCVLAYAYGAVHLGDRMQVLAVARPVAAGQAIVTADITSVSATRDTEVRLVPAAQARQVVGRTAVVPLVAGTLLTPGLLGDAAFPPAGKVSASLALKPGQYPQGLAPGARVAVFVSTAPPPGSQPMTPASSGPPRLLATVLSVDPGGDAQGSTVVTVLLDSADALRLAAATSGGVVLMQTAPQTGG